MLEARQEWRALCVILCTGPVFHMKSPDQVNSYYDMSPCESKR